MNEKRLSLEQTWRVVRLFGTTFGHLTWVGMTDLDPAAAAALTGVLVGATEGAYRAVFPAGHRRLVHVIAEIVAAATAEPKTVVQVQASATSVENPAPSSALPPDS